MYNDTQRTPNNEYSMSPERHKTPRLKSMVSITGENSLTRKSVSDKTICIPLFPADMSQPFLGLAVPKSQIHIGLNDPAYLTKTGIRIMLLICNSFVHIRRNSFARRPS